MKKEYTAPLTGAIEIKMSQHVLTGSITSINSGDTGIGLGGGGTGPARGPEFIDIDDTFVNMLLGQ